MTDVGRELAEAREERAMPLEELSRRTKISEALLRAIERNDAKKLPRGICMRGFLRAYAREVGCDPERIVERYRAQPGNQELDGRETLDPLPDVVKARRDSCRVHAAEVDAQDRRRARAQFIGTVVLLSGGILFVLLSVSPSRPGVEAAVPAPAGTGGSLGELSPIEPADPIEEASNNLRLGIQSRGLSWLSATADGQRVVYRLLNAGEHTSIEALEDVVLRVGDPASVELTVNGVAARPLGPVGRAVTIHLTRQNYQEFLVAR